MKNKILGLDGEHIEIIVSKYETTPCPIRYTLDQIKNAF